MSITSQDIVALERHLTDLKKQLGADYAAFGESCALIERQRTLGCCRDEWQAYETCLESVTELEKVCAKQKRRLDLISDKKGRIRQTEKDLQLAARQRKELAGRLGAVAYEAYQSGVADEALRAASATWFDGYLKETQRLETMLLKGGVVASWARTRLSLLRRRTGALFQHCGEDFLDHDQCSLLPDAHLAEEASLLVSRQQELTEDLAAARSNVSSLQEEVDNGKKALEEAKSQLSVMQAKLQQLASVYGKAVYDQIPPDVIARDVGQIAYEQGLAIVQRLDAIAQTQQRIQSLRNQMQIDELNAQMELDNQKIAHLEEQEQAIEQQISEVQRSIAERRRKIRDLSGADHG